MLGTNISSYYEVLNIPPSASKTEIREAYIRLRNTFSGQNQALYSLFDETEAQAMLERVEEAFRVLSDGIARQNQVTGLGQGVVAGATAHDSPAGLKGPEPAPTFDKYNRVAQATKASQANSESIQEKLQALIAEGDISDGNLYRRIREAVGVSEDEMQARTKIGIDHIRGIESNTFERLPKPIFVKGFLRSYFRYLGVKDHGPLVEAFSEKFTAFLDTSEE